MSHAAGNDSMQTIHVDERKWPDSRHWHFDADRLGEDRHGTWMFVSADTVIQRGREPERLAGVDFLVLIPPDRPWLIEFYREHPTHTVYINIGTVPTWDGDRVKQIDLDLDVLLTRDGSVAVVDRHEFEENQVTLAYPEDVIRLAERAALDAADLLTNRVPPFDDAPVRWWSLADTGR